MMQQLTSRRAQWVLSEGRVLNVVLDQLGDAYLVYRRSRSTPGHFLLRHYPAADVAAAFADLRQAVHEALRDVPLGTTGGVTLSHYVSSDHDGFKDVYIDFVFRPKQAQGRFDLLILHPRRGIFYTVDDFTLSPAAIFVALQAAATAVAQVATGHAYLCPTCGTLFVSPHTEPDSCLGKTCAETTSFERIAQLHLEPMLEQMFYAFGALKAEPDPLRFGPPAILRQLRDV